MLTAQIREIGGEETFTPLDQQPCRLLLPSITSARQGEGGIRQGHRHRSDVMMYIAGALDTFEMVGSRKRQEIALEIALKGQRGLDINDPAQKYTLRTLPGNYSGLHLLAIMYAAFQQIDPAANVGADF